VEKEKEKLDRMAPLWACGITGTTIDAGSSQNFIPRQNSELNSFSRKTNTIEVTINQKEITMVKI